MQVACHNLIIFVNRLVITHFVELQKNNELDMPAINVGIMKKNAKLTVPPKIFPLIANQKIKPAISPTKIDVTRPAARTFTK